MATKVLYRQTSTTTTGHVFAATGVLSENDSEVPTAEVSKKAQTQTDYKATRQIVWFNVIAFAILHLTSLYGFYLVLTLQVKIATLLFSYVLYMMGGVGITAGAHRLWAHRSYKAKWPMRVILAFMQTLAFQNSVYEWCRDHRVHHKFTETDADPHNAIRGFFFSHMGWLLVKKHPEVKVKGQTIDLSDLEADPIVRFQKIYYKRLVFVVCFLFPTLVPYYLWGESYWNGYFVSAALRYCITLHATWLVNSAAHMWGNKPYDQHMNPSENLAVSLGAMGEGWHNYHHVFPWDYKAAELGNYRYNITTAFIDFFAKMGLAYDLKSVSRDMVMKRALRTGDGTHPIWGWGDKDLTPEDARLAEQSFARKLED